MVSLKVVLLFSALCVALVSCRSAHDSAEQHSAEHHSGEQAHSGEHQHSGEQHDHHGDHHSGEHEQPQKPNKPSNNKPSNNKPLPKPKQAILPGGLEDESRPSRLRATPIVKTSDKTIQSEIVNMHNKLRAGTPGSDIMELTWDDEIAKIAQQTAEMCVDNHPTDQLLFQSSRFKLGQNLYSCSPTPNSWTQAIQKWYDEIKDFSYGGQSRGVTGHYTQVVWGKTYRIGCGYKDCGGKHLYFCNYGPGGNVGTDLPYTKGSQGSKCANGAGNQKLCKAPTKLPQAAVNCRESDLYSNCADLKSACNQGNIASGCKRTCTCKFTD